MRCLLAGLTTLLLCGCGATASTSNPTTTTTSNVSSTSSATPIGLPSAEPATLDTLLAVAQRLNDDFGSGRYAQVYQRWDPQSRALISGEEYVRRHVQCQTAPQDPTHILRAVFGADGYWRVTYILDELRFVDYWRYRAGHWEFDLIRSNPDAVRLYRMNPQAYASAVACNG